MTKKEAAVALRKAAFMAQVLEEPAESVAGLRKAFAQIEGLPINPKLALTSDLIKKTDLNDFPRKMLLALSDRGVSEDLDRLKQRFPQGLFEIRKLTGLTAAQIGLLYKANIESIEALEKAGRDGTLARDPGFGADLADQVLDAIERYRQNHTAHLLSKAVTEGERLGEHLRRCPDVIRFNVVGELRRVATTVKTIDLLASSAKPAAVITHFLSSVLVDQVLAESEHRVTVMLVTRVKARLHVVPDDQFACRQHFLSTTFDYRFVFGTRADQLGFKLTERGLFKNDVPVPCREESEIYAHLGLTYIPPEARTATEEIAYAETGAPFDLVNESDIKGLLHMHSTDSDGSDSIEQLARHAQSMGMTYIGITDHSRSSVYANGLDVDRVAEQHEKIDALNQKLHGIQILKGSEVDILEDGSLDYPDAVLARFDFVIASVHQKTGMDVDGMTRRIVRALSHPYVDILGHVTGRLLLRQDGYAVHHKEIINAAAEFNKVIELNANPQRLDIDWRYLRYMRKKGVMTAINPDAHVSRRLSDFRFGVWMARKSLLRKTDVLNCLDLPAITRFFKERRGG